jgi:hypothetical protein
MDFSMHWLDIFLIAMILTNVIAALLFKVLSVGEMRVTNVGLLAIYFTFVIHRFNTSYHDIEIIYPATALFITLLLFTTLKTNKKIINLKTIKGE